MSLEVQALRDPRALLVGWDGIGSLALCVAPEDGLSPRGHS